MNANAELYDYLNQNQGTGFINISDKTLATLSENYAFNQIRYATDQNPYPNIFTHGFSAQRYPTIHVSIPTDSCSTPILIKSHLLGDFQVNNIMAAACIGRYFSVPIHHIQSALESYIPSNNRSQVFNWKENTVLLDAYNANPSSMSAMLHYFSNYPAEKKTIILGDMFELGNSATEEHEKIVSQVKACEFDSVILVGKLFESFKDTLMCTHCHNVTELKHFLDSASFHNHTFLVKGSRGMRLENAF
jgi:UDP-N-acetylmuramoyl-tripeptide--D-alanyl-D-alanine ligase